MRVESRKFYLLVVTRALIHSYPRVSNRDQGDIEGMSGLERM